MRVLRWAGFAALAVGGLASGAVMVSALAMAGSRDVAAERTLQAKQVAATISKQPAHLYLTVAIGVGEEKASRVVPPVSNLKIKVPRGRRDRYPEHPKKVEELGARYGVGGSLKRLAEALGKMPR